MTVQNLTPDGIDISRPNVARIYDYLLGGKDNFAADREAAKRLIQAIPDVAAIARDNRSFLGRVVRYLAIEGGIRRRLRAHRAWAHLDHRMAARAGDRADRAAAFHARRRRA
jgi:hypothetical protein